MRITNNMMARSQLDGLSRAMVALDAAQKQVTTGKRIQVASDDPTAASQILDTNSALRALDQYRANVQAVSNRVAQEDSVLQQVNEVLTRVKVIAVQQGTATATDQTRAAARAEVQQLFQQLVSLGNTKFGNEYMFGGEQSQTAPFTVTGSGATLDYSTTNPQNTRAVAIGDGESVQMASTGTALFVDTGVLDAVKQLARALDPASATYGQTGTAAAASSADTALSALQGRVGDVGAKEKQLDSAQQNIDAYKTNLTTFKSNLEDVDIESAVTELTNRQVAYQAAMLATSKVMGLTLTDYLK